MKSRVSSRSLVKAKEPKSTEKHTKNFARDTMRDTMGLASFVIAGPRPMDYRQCMTAVAEIELAIEKLSPSEVKELAAWLDEYQQMVNASAEIFSLYDQEEGAKS